MFMKVQRWRSWRKTLKPLWPHNFHSLLPTFHILGKYSRTCDRNLVAYRETKNGRSRCKYVAVETIYDRHISSRSSSWKRLCGELTFYPNQSKRTLKQLFNDQGSERNPGCIRDQLAATNVAKDNIAYLIRQFSYQKQKPTYSPTQYWVSKGSVKIPSRLGRRRLIGFRIHINIENYRIDGEPMEIEWTIIPGFTTLQILAEIQNMMTEIKCIVWIECIASSLNVAEDTKRFAPSHRSFLGPGSETKCCGTRTYKTNGEWDKVAEIMMINFCESGHPVFRGCSALERGELKSKGK